MKRPRISQGQVKLPRIPILTPVILTLGLALFMGVDADLRLRANLEDLIVGRKLPDAKLLNRTFSAPAIADVDDEWIKQRVILDTINGLHRSTGVLVLARNPDGGYRIAADNLKAVSHAITPDMVRVGLMTSDRMENDEGEYYKIRNGVRIEHGGADLHLIAAPFNYYRGETISTGRVVMITNVSAAVKKPSGVVQTVLIRIGVAFIAGSALFFVICVAPVIKLTRQLRRGQPTSVAWWVPKPINALAEQLALDRAANERFRLEANEFRASIDLQSRVIEFSPVPTFICQLPKTGKEAIITYANKAVTNLFGHETPIGQPLNILVPQPYWIYHTWDTVPDEPLNRGVGMAGCPHAGAGESRVMGKQRPVPAITQDGRTLQVLLSVDRIADEPDGSRNFIGTLQNISDLMASQEAERIAREEAESRRETMSVELQGFNHDVKNAIGGILKMYSSLERSLEKRDAKSAFTERESQYLDRILISATRLHRLNEGMREIRRLDQRKLGEYTPWEIFDAVRRDFTDTNIAWQQQEGFKVTCDIDKVSVNVISNLIQNAKIYCGPSPIIQVRAELKDQFGVFAVTDNGPGIPEEKQAVVFNLGAGSRLNSSIEGTGMGLYQAKKTIESFGGKIWVRNNPGDTPGCTFFFSIPAE